MRRWHTGHTVFRWGHVTSPGSLTAVRERVSCVTLGKGRGIIYTTFEFLEICLGTNLQRCIIPLTAEMLLQLFEGVWVQCLSRTLSCERLLYSSLALGIGCLLGRKSLLHGQQQATHSISRNLIHNQGAGIWKMSIWTLTTCPFLGMLSDIRSRHQLTYLGLQVIAMTTLPNIWTKELDKASLERVSGRKKIWRAAE